MKIKLVVFDFDGVFTDNSVYVNEDGKESVRCFRGDGIGLKNLSKLGIGALVLSSEVNPVVSKRCEKLGMRCIQGVKDKLADLHRLRIPLEEIAFVGNDVNDLSCLKAVGLPIVVHDAHPDVLDHAKYITRANGGHGAVREVCDMLEAGKWA